MNADQNAFLQKIVPASQAAMRKWGVPASVTLAQAILESAWGKSALARQANNYFGIKTSAYGSARYIELPTKEVISGDLVRESARFAKYATAAASFDAHAVLLSSFPRYKPAMEVRRDPFAFARQLQTCGYSTDPNYGSKLIDLINRYDLTQYDLPPDEPAKAQEVAA